MKKILITVIVFIVTNMVAQNDCAAQIAPNALSKSTDPIINKSIESLTGKNVVKLTLKINGNTNIFKKYSEELGGWEGIEITKNAYSSISVHELASDNKTITFSLSITEIEDVNLKVDLNLKKVFVLKGKNKLKSTVVFVSAFDTAGNAKPIIGNTIKLESLEIAQHDFPSSMSQQYAKEECEMLGNGWRLPNKAELNILYKNKIKIGGFLGQQYLCSNRKAEKGDDVWTSDTPWILNFNNGVGEYSSRITDEHYFRAVKSIK